MLHSSLYYWYHSTESSTTEAEKMDSSFVVSYPKESSEFCDMWQNISEQSLKFPLQGTAMPHIVENYAYWL